MTGSKCVICKKKKGKRFCPEQKGMICGQCCGKRIYERIGCPEDCMYWKSSRNYTKQKRNQITTSETDEVQKTELELIALMEMAVHDLLKKDVYYEDRDILLGTERKTDVLEHPKGSYEVLLNRTGVIESKLDEVIKTAHFEAGDRFSDECIKGSLKTYALMIKRMGNIVEGGHKYIDSLKERVSKYEEGLKDDGSKREDVPGYPLITLPFSQ